MKIRTECPKKNNRYYNNKSHGGLSDAVNGYPMISGLTVLDNCVGWANSRFNEVINDPNLEGIVKKFRYQLVCDAEDFIESAKRQGLKINPTPVEGGIMVWQKGATLGSGDGAGHVAVVERVYKDGTILTSESGWASWTFKTVRRDNNNGRWGQNSAYKFRGCIINPAVKDPKVVPVPPLNVDGVAGACTIRALQRFLGTLQDGVLSGQNKSLKKYYPGITAVEYGKGGSACVKKLQSWLGITADGVWGKKTSKALQEKLGVTADGIFGANSVKALQKFLNDHDKATDPKPSTPSVEPDKDKKVYDFIDVSDWQGEIDWAKVKAAGIDGAIIRYADGTTLDKRFERNMAQAKYHGLHVGTYIFSRAKTKAEAEKEAERLYKAAKKYEPDMPYYIDLEVSSLAKYADTVAAAFLNKMAALEVRGGVYANLNWWNNYLTKTAKDYSASAFWIAQYNDTMDYRPASRMGMWQYTSSGSVNGISGKVDRDKCYVAYWKNQNTWQDRAVNWAEKIAKDDSYHYVKWVESDKKTHQCCICHDLPKEDKGFNCIRFVLATWRHGGGLKIKHEGAVLNDALFDQLLSMALKKAAKLVSDKLGVKCQVIRNGGKPLAESKLKKADYLVCYNGDKYSHSVMNEGDGKVIDCTSGKKDQIASRPYSTYASKIKLAIRVVGE